MKRLMKRVFGRRWGTSQAMATCPPGHGFAHKAVRVYIKAMPVTPYVTKDDFYDIVDTIYARTHRDGPFPIPDSAHPNCLHWRKVWLSIQHLLKESGKAIQVPKPPPMGGIALNPLQQALWEVAYQDQPQQGRWGGGRFIIR